MERTERDIVQAFNRLLAHRGVDKITTQMIADEAGVIGKSVKICDADWKGDGRQLGGVFVNDAGANSPLDLGDKGGLYTRNQKLDYLGIVRDNLLLKKLLRGAESVRILQCRPDHSAQVVRELLGAEQLRRDLIGQNGRDARLVLRNEPLPPSPERHPGEPMPPCPLVRLEQHRDRNPVCEIADGSGNEDRNKPVSNNRWRRPHTRTPQDRQHQCRDNRSNAHGLAYEFRKSERPDNARPTRVAGDVKL